MGDVMKTKKWIIGILIMIGYCYVLKYMFQVIFPFALAILCYFMMKPVIERLERYFHVKKSAIGISLLLVIYLLLALLLGGIITYALMKLFGHIQQIPDYYENYFLPVWNQLILWLQSEFPSLLKGDTFVAIQDFLSQYLFQMISYLSNFVTHIPAYLLTFFIFIISTFFLVLDYDQIRNQIVSFCHPRFVSSFVFIKNQCLKSLWQYVKCQLILMIICFVILWIGFMIMRFQHAFLYAVGTALLDSLPFIGVGIVLIPICIVYLLQKAYLKAFYIFLIYLIINVMRGILEPQIMNKQMQVPSFVLLLSMMIHLYFFGVIGIILSPIHMSIIYALLSSSHDLARIS